MADYNSFVLEGIKIIFAERSTRPSGRGNTASFKTAGFQNQVFTKVRECHSNRFYYPLLEGVQQ